MPVRLPPTGSLGAQNQAEPVVLVDQNGAVISMGSGTSAQNVQGAAAQASTTTINPVLVAGRYNATLPTLTDGQLGRLQSDAGGSLRARLIGNNATGTDALSNTLGFVTGATSTTNSLLMGVGGYGFNGTTWDRVRGDTVGISTQPGLVATHWTYAAAANGITNTTTAVTVKATAGASVRNVITSIQVSAGTLGAATEVVIRDGAAGTVLWRIFVGTGGINANFTLPVPIFGTANTLLEVATLTATVTGGVYVNLQGFTRA